MSRVPTSATKNLAVSRRLEAAMSWQPANCNLALSLRTSTSFSQMNSAEAKFMVSILWLLLWGWSAKHCVRCDAN